MGRSYFLKLLLLLLTFLLFSFSHGFGRKLMETVEVGVEDFSLETKETARNLRELIETLDYQLDPGPNTNPKTGLIPPPQGVN